MRSQLATTLSLLVALLGMTACRDADLLYYYDPKPARTFDKSTLVKEVVGGGDVNVLWVIDNSRSMTTHQMNVIANTQRFLSAFLQASNINWKMGLLSTDTYDSPFLGMSPGDEFTSSSANPTQTFQQAVRRLGTMGSGYEKGFDPVINAVTRYPGFLHSNAQAPFAVIFVTDAYEQSVINAGAQVFLSKLRSLIGPKRKILVYGAFAANDLGCPPGDGEDFWRFRGSAYEQAITSTRGFWMNLCSPDFGSDLAKISREIVSQISSPRLFLATRPKIDTLRVSYQGRVLPPGLPEQGGMWFYDADLNAIEFYSLDFAGGVSNELVDIYYEEEREVNP